MKGEYCWIINSGASQHRTSNCDLLVNYQQFLKPEPVVLGDGRSGHALGTSGDASGHAGHAVHD